MTESDDYLVQLRDTAADPHDAVIVSCQNCPHRVAFRVWPDDRDADALEAFLDGLTELSHRLGVPTYGFWLLDGGRGEPPAQTQRCQLWRAADRTLVTDSTFANATLALDVHLCPVRN